MQPRKFLLTLSNPGGDAGVKYLCDGIAENPINNDLRGATALRDDSRHTELIAALDFPPTKWSVKR